MNKNATLSRKLLPYTVAGLSVFSLIGIYSPAAQAAQFITNSALITGTLDTNIRPIVITNVLLDPTFVQDATEFFTTTQNVAGNVDDTGSTAQFYSSTTANTTIGVNTIGNFNGSASSSIDFTGGITLTSYATGSVTTNPPQAGQLLNRAIGAGLAYYQDELTITGVTGTYDIDLGFGLTGAFTQPNVIPSTTTPTGQSVIGFGVFSDYDIEAPAGYVATAFDAGSGLYYTYKEYKQTGALTDNPTFTLKGLTAGTPFVLGFGAGAFVDFFTFLPIANSGTAVADFGNSAVLNSFQVVDPNTGNPVTGATVIGTSGFTYQDNIVPSVPEPTSMLALVGLAGAGLGLKKKRQS